MNVGMVDRSKEVMVIEEKENELLELCKLIKSMADVEIIRTSSIKEAYQNIFRPHIEMIVVRIAVNKFLDNEQIAFIEQVRQIEGLAFVPIIIVVSEEVDWRLFFEYFHCFGILDVHFNLEYAKKMIADALRFHKAVPQKEFVYFKIDGVLKSARISDILYFEAHKGCTVVHTQNDCFRISNCSSTEICKLLGDYDFMVCAKGIVVNMKQISYLDTTKRRIYFCKKETWINYGQVYGSVIKSYLKSRCVI